MQMKELFEIVFNIAMLGFVAGSMITLGLGLTVTQIIAPFKKIRIVIRALLANFIIVPLFALGIVSWFPVSEGVRIGILILSLGGGAPFIPMVVATAKGNVAGSVGFMVLLLIATLMIMPFTLPIVLSGASVGAWDIARTLISIMLLPLVFALFIRALFTRFAQRTQPFAARFTNLSILTLVIAVLFLYTETIIESVDMLPVIVSFFVGAMFIGYFSAGKKRDLRTIFSVGTGLRNPPVAILVASQNFSEQPIAAIVPLLLAIIGMMILLPLAILMGRKVRAKRKK